VLAEVLLAQMSQLVAGVVVVVRIVAVPDIAGSHPVHKVVACLVERRRRAWAAFRVLQGVKGRCSNDWGWGDLGKWD